MRRVLICAALLALAGCSHIHPKGAPDSKSSASDKISSAIASAARDAAAGGMTQESLMFQEKLYKQDPRDAANIVNYAHGLRRAGRIDDAELVIRTPATDKRAGAPMLTEAAMVMISAGNYDEGLDFAQKALDKDGKSPDAHHALALALSGLGKNADAQLQFQKALDLWPDDRDTTPVINNLAMSLAAQGKIKEARGVMRLATGQALDSSVYQNNRAMLDSLKDTDVVVMEKIAAPTESGSEVISLSPARIVEGKKDAPEKPTIQKPATQKPKAQKTASKKSFRMQPIVE
ncbi:MAG: tetratricopeptide repeat protein [Rhodospirillales bacterium]|nr:tetratricopeptide repeat protein [Alphaproteobacteria bacterium]MCB9986189.1 tetratricopeptide repeat protein [Rhodospirillales bacterium]USO07254.1 MAG: tetratricopeptide repeat protein [Rhodospirillales bacterium]